MRRRAAARPTAPQPVVHMAGTTLRHDEAMPAQHREMLREMGCLETRLLLELGDAALLRGAEKFQDPDAKWVGKALEEVRLDLVQRLLPMSQ